VPAQTELPDEAGQQDERRPGAGAFVDHAEPLNLDLLHATLPAAGFDPTYLGTDVGTCPPRCR